MTKPVCACDICRGVALDVPTRFAVSAVKVGESLVRGLLGDASCPSWLEAEVGAGAASPAAWQRFAAVGLLGRLWSPVTGDAGRTLGAMLKGWETPCQRVQTWAAGLSDEVQRELVVLLLGEACGLQEDMEALGRARGRQARALLLEDAWRRRDAMQSVWVLLSGEAGKVVESVLTGLDALMRGLLPGLRRVPVRVDDHLGAASWQEVGEWWVDLVEHPER